MKTIIRANEVKMGDIIKILEGYDDEKGSPRINYKKIKVDRMEQKDKKITFTDESTGETSTVVITEPLLVIRGE